MQPTLPVAGCVKSEWEAVTVVMMGLRGDTESMVSMNLLHPINPLEPVLSSRSGISAFLDIFFKNEKLTYIKEEIIKQYTVVAYEFYDICI